MPSADLHRRTVLKGVAALGAAALAGRPVDVQTDESGTADGLETFVDGLMAAHLEAYDVAGATVAVVGDGETLLAKGYGYADVERERPVVAEETLFRIASVSKLFGWTGVMQGVERGDLDLETDVNTYLEDVSIPEAYDEPITLEHLGTHTPGFEDRIRGTFVEESDDLRPLGEVLAAEQPARVRPPGELGAYSNYGAALAGHIVAMQDGGSFEEYVRENVFAPLGMERSTFAQPVPDALSGDLSKGYRYQDGAFREGEFEYIGIPPAGSMSASATDMARFMLAQLNGGAIDGGRILEPGTVEEMHRRRFAHDERVNGVCYGFYEMGRNGERVIGHGGDTELFHSHLMLLPERDVGLFVSYNSPGGVTAREEFVEAFLDRFVGTPDPPDEPAEAPTRAEEIRGSYRTIRYAHTTYEKLGALVGMLDVRVEDDTLVTDGPEGVERWIEVEPLVFRREDGKETLVFGEEDGDIVHLFLGSRPVTAYERLERYEGPTTQLVAIGLSLLVLLSAAVGWSSAGLWRRYRGRPPETERPRVARWTAGVASVLLLGFVVGFVLFAVLDTTALLTGTPTALLALLVLPLLGAIATVGALVTVVLAWRDGYWGLLGRLHYTLVVLALLVLLGMLRYWNLLGFNV